MLTYSLHDQQNKNLRKTAITISSTLLSFAPQLFRLLLINYLLHPVTR